MLSVMNRKVLALAIGGVAMVGLAAPSAWAQTGKPGAPSAGQPEHHDKGMGHKDKDSKAKAKVGEQAPDFELKDTDGKTVKLSDYKGKIVVIDWVSPVCPVCQMHYKAGTLQNLESKFKGDNVVFLGINSGGAAAEMGGGKTATADFKKELHVDFPLLIDESGKVGHTYGAKTTPHCFVVDKNGTLVYNGAIDDGSPNHVGKTNYVEKAVSETLKGETVSTKETRPYGCGVHYGKGA